MRVQVDRAAGEVRYQVSFWTWASYGIYLCLGIGAVAGFFALSPLFGLYIFPENQYPSLPIIRFMGIPMVVFWGLVWPWILIPCHKGPAARLLTRILDEVKNEATVPTR